jgi:glycosyltransferase involved in cell wall biosynthesis
MTPGVEHAPIRVASLIKRLHVGGDETRLLMLARHFDPAVVDHSVVVVHATDRERDARIGEMVSAFRHAGVEVNVLGSELLTAGRNRGLRDLTDAGRVARRLVRVFRDHRVDVVDARLEFGTVFGVLTARLARIPVVVSTGYSPKYWASAVRYPLGQMAFCSLDALISDSATTLAEYDRWRLSRHARMELIPNGIMPALPERSRDETKAVLGVPTGRPVIGQVARMTPRKGYETLIRAARMVVDQEPDVCFLLCGFAEDQGYRRRLKQLVATLSLQDNVVATSYQGPIGDVLGVLDVFAHLSTFDSSPIAVHEAMSAGLPAVVSRVGGTDELIADNQSGLLVPPGEAEPAASALLRLLRDPPLRARLGEGARERYLVRHRPETMARAHERLYLDLLEQRRRERVRR